MKFIYIITLTFLGLGVVPAREALTCPEACCFGHPLGDTRLYADTLLADLLAKTKVPGVSITVRKAGQIVYEKGVGYAHIAEAIPMTPTTRIRTASVAKVLTATALGRLATEGKLNFDAPLKEYLSDLPGSYADLTIRQVAGHTAGVPHRPATRRVKRKHYAEVKETLQFFEKLPLLFEPGGAYRYSTLGYNLLAAVIEEVSGSRYVDYIKKEVFRPLGMAHTIPDDKSTRSDTDAQMYYMKKGKPVLDRRIQDGSYKLAGAGFRSTSSDLAKMMEAYTNGFLSPDVVQGMFRSGILQDGTHTNVGIGWRLNQAPQNRPTIEHAGSWQGARTVIVYYPKQQLTVAMMINAKCTLFIEETAHLIAQLFLEDDPLETDFTGFDNALDITNHRSDGSVESYPGRLAFSDRKKGVLEMDTNRGWLRENRVYHLSGDNHFALSTRYGLMYLRLQLPLTTQGEMFQYQVLGDPHHMRQQPMLVFRAGE